MRLTYRIRSVVDFNAQLNPGSGLELAAVIKNGSLITDTYNGTESAGNKIAGGPGAFDFTFVAGATTSTAMSIQSGGDQDPFEVENCSALLAP